MGADDPRAPGVRVGSTEATSVVARLRVVHPTDLDWVEVIPQETTIIGRNEARGIAMALTHGTVSRRHFELSWDDVTGRHLGRDLDSHNGSRVDGEDIGRTSVTLEDNSVLQLGDVCLVYERLPADLAAAPPTPRDEPIPGDSPPTVQLRRALERWATDPSPVLIHGPMGTGKGSVAKELHRLGKRAGPLVSVDCSDRNAHALQSQLFGHVRGAFDGAEHDARGVLRAASGGTVVLEKVGELPASLQPTLHRALVDGRARPMGGAEPYPLDVRVVATTQVDLGFRADAGGFDANLYRFLARATLKVPSLCERRGDLLTWLQRLQDRWVDAHPDADASALTLSAEAAESVLLHDWPRNLLDLERLVDELLSAPHVRRPIARMRLPSWLRNSNLLTSDGRVTAEVGPPAFPRPEPSREELVTIYRRYQGNLRAIARHYAQDLRQIDRWIHVHGLDAGDLEGD